NLNHNLTQLQDTQQKLSSGKSVSKPSDDPVRVNQCLNLGTAIADNDQYVRNIDFTTAWMETNDSTMGQHVDALQRVRELSVRGASGSLSDTDRKAIAAEVDQIREQERQIANTQYNGRFIFGGYKTMPKPSLANPNGDLYPPDVTLSPNDSGKLEVELSPGTRLSYNTRGIDLLGNTSTADNVFKVLDDISSELKNGDGQAVSASLGKLDKWIDIANEERAIGGGKLSRMELSKNRLLDANISLQKLRSENEDVDMAQTISDLNMQQNVYQAALSVGAKVLQPSLMDFLR
ncbi:MAG TPA: flagellar hook-associated protein FlgL, partial [Chroococcales cyanobacterium]